MLKAVPIKDLSDELCHSSLPLLFPPPPEKTCVLIIISYALPLILLDFCLRNLDVALVLMVETEAVAVVVTFSKERGKRDII